MGNGGLYGIGCFLFFLCSIMEVRWWIAIVLILVSIIVMVFFRISKFSLIFRIDGLCVVHLASTVIMIRLGKIQLLLCISSINGAYFSIFSCIFSYKNWLLV